MTLQLGGLWAAAALGTGLLVWGLRPWLRRWGAQDQPNARSMHKKPVLRGGGLAVVVCQLVFWLGLGVAGSLKAGEWAALLVGGLAVAGVGFWDDLRGLSARRRLGVHGVAAVLAVVGASGLPGGVLGAAGLALAGVAIVWMINLTNFMDGIDGILGTQLLTTSLAMAVFAALSGDFTLAALFAALSGSAAGFLFWNWSPARVFCGDVGSGFAGYAWAALAWFGYTRGAWPFFLPVLIYAFFEWDATATLFKRLWAGKRILEAHREHFYQRLVLKGWSHARVALLVGAVNVLIAFAAHRLFWRALKLQDVPLWPDCANYWSAAASMHHPWDLQTYVEPPWLWAIQVLQLFPGAEPGWLRVLGAAAYAAATGLLFVTLRRLSGSLWLGLLGAAFMVLDRSMTGMAVEGPRDVGALFFAALWAWGSLGGKRVAHALGFAGLVGSRFTFLAPTLVIELLLGLTLKGDKKPRLQGVFMGLVLAAGIIAPTMAVHAKRFGDPFYSVNVPAIWWRNHEFVNVRGTGCDGCPTREVIQREGLVSGGKITPGQWLFGMHSLREIATQTASGFGSIFFGSLFYALTSLKGAFQAAVFLVGLVILGISPYRALLLLPFLWVNFLAFAAHLELDPRFLMYLVPFHCGVLALGYGWLVRTVAWRLGRLAKRASLAEPF